MGLAGVTGLAAGTCTAWSSSSWVVEWAGVAVTCVEQMLRAELPQPETLMEWVKPDCPVGGKCHQPYVSVVTLVYAPRENYAEGCVQDNFTPHRTKRLLSRGSLQKQCTI